MAIVPRAPTPTIEPQEVFRPQAAPVDTYIRPPEPAPSDLHNLAKGLENFSRDIRGMFQAREARDAEAAQIRGEAQFFQDNQVGYAEAVRQGKIPAFASRPFMEAYKEAEGKVIGARLASQMQLEYQTWEGRNTQDPANFDTFMADSLKRNLSQDDPAVLKGAMPYIYSTVNAGYSQRTQDAADAAYNGSLDAHVAVSSMAIDAASDEGLSSGQGTDYDALWEELIAQRDTTLTSGIRSLDYDKKFIEVIAAKAIEERDPALLALLDRNLPGQDAPISATPYGREVKARTIDSLETVNVQAENAAYTAQQRRDKAMKDELTSFAIEAIMADPNVVLPDNFWTEFEKVEPEARIKVQDWRNSALNGDQEDQEAIASLTYRILVGGENAMDVINEGTRGGIIRDPATLQKLYQFGQETPVWQSTQSYRLGLDAIKQMAGMGNGLGADGGFAFDPNYVPPAATAAALDFELSMRAWAQTEEGKAAIASGNMAAIATETTRIQKVITDSFVLSPTAPAHYVQPTEITEDLEDAGTAANPLSPSQGALDEAAAADALRTSLGVSALPAWTEGGLELTPLPPDEQWDLRWASGNQPELTTLPAEEQQFIREESDRLGIDPQLYLEETYRQVEQIIREVEGGAAIEQGIEDTLNNAPARLPDLAPPGGGGGSRTLGTEPEIQGVAPILDLIGDTEGTDRGDGYNETLGYGAYTGGDVNLTEMTLGEVRTLQADMLSHPNNSWDSSAVGRYQIVGQTLQGLIEELNLPLDTKFTPELQDRLALHLLKRRGLQEWLGGTLTTEAFQDALSEEWASLPNSLGSGTYEGQRIGTDTAGLKGALALLK